MDLSANLGFEVTPSTKTILECNNNLRQILSLKENDKWFNVFSNSNLPTFSFPNLDSFSQDISYQLNSNLYLQILGLGQESLLYQDMCSHAHSAGLKFYLALLKFQPNSNLIIDGVAGTDMLNYGLYLGCNASIVSLENHINSQRVLDKADGVRRKRKEAIRLTEELLRSTSCSARSSAATAARVGSRCRTDHSGCPRSSRATRSRACWVALEL